MPQNNPQAYVTGLYDQLLGRQPEQAGMDFWTGQMQQGASPFEVMMGVFNSPERFLGDTYQEILGRKPDQLGNMYFQNVLQNHGPGQVRREMLMSPEAQNYMLGHSDDPYRNAARMAAVNAGPMTYMDYGFHGAGSPEFMFPSHTPAAQSVASVPQPQWGEAGRLPSFGDLVSQIMGGGSQKPKEDEQVASGGHVRGANQLPTTKPAPPPGPKRGSSQPEYKEVIGPRGQHWGGP